MHTTSDWYRCKERLQGAHAYRMAIMAYCSSGFLSRVALFHDMQSDTWRVLVAAIDRSDTKQRKTLISRYILLSGNHERKDASRSNFIPLVSDVPTCFGNQVSSHLLRSNRERLEMSPKEMVRPDLWSCQHGTYWNDTRYLLLVLVSSGVGELIMSVIRGGGLYDGQACE